MGFVSISLSQKWIIADKREERAGRGEDIGVQALATWAKEKLNLHIAHRIGTISRILRDVATQSVANDGCLNKYRQKRGVNQNEERALLGWITDFFNFRVAINGVLIKMKASKLQLKFNVRSPDAEKT